MRHKKATATLDRKAGPRNALVRTLTISLIEHNSIQTTPTKAKAVQQMLEPLITKGKEKTVSSIRHIESVLGNKKAALVVVNRIAPRYKNRAGGYTSTVKVANRKGDGAQQVQLTLVSEDNA